MNESFPKQERPIIPFEESLKLAKDLIEKHRQDMRDIVLVPEKMPPGDKDALNWGKSPIAHFLRGIPEDIRSKFEGHGIYKVPGKFVGSAEAFHLAAFINILQNGAVKGESARLARSGYYDAITTGEFLLVSHFAKSLPRFPENRQPGQSPITNEIGWVADAGAYVVSTKYYPMLDELRAMFPEVNLIKASELPDYIRKEAGL